MIAANRIVAALLILALILAACAPALPFDSGLTPVTPIPSPNPADTDSLCAAVDAAWNADWPAAIRALEDVLALGETCPDGQPTDEKLYAAHYHYGQSLAASGQMSAMLAQYWAALDYRPGGLEVVRALRQLGVFTPTPLDVCTPDEIRAVDTTLADYVASDVAGFAAVQGSGFAVNGAAYPVRGVNYYPAHYPWRRFLTQADLVEVQGELALLRGAGLNTLRLFLWHDALFTCPGSGAIPVPEAFIRLDAIIRVAAAQGFRLILTLNDLPDLDQYPLYSSPQHTQDQVAYVVQRYRAEAAILAWDLRNEGDLDYQPEHAGSPTFEREDVLTWLAQTAEAVRALDPDHLITAGWSQDAEATIPYVDFVSFHHWDDAIRLRARVALLRSLTDKPILLEAFGYSTYHFSPDDQSRLLREAIQAADYDGVAGWLIWTAFDFSADVTCDLPACPLDEGAAHHFGLWQSDYTPKLAANVLTILTAE